MLNLLIHAKGGVGRSVVGRMALEEMTRPKGKWREYWTLHLAKISPNNRLPRNFKKKRIYIDSNQDASRGFSAAIERSMLG
ncbi:hypothetical protein [Pseudomonas sp. NPDC096950]|uniref:hypothetical protein n=1 Tax=Pseudomonas sp. NPDC096950 TaxID=3364485 RepID=UPI00383A1DD1